MLVQFWVFYVAQAFARDDHDVPTGQQMLVETKRIAHQTLQAVALNGELDALFPDHEPQAGMIQAVLTGKEQETLAWHLAGWRVKDRFEVSGCQKTFFPTEVLTHHLCRKIKLPDAYGLWHDGGTVRHGRSW